jgi:hypothetical protein
MRKQLASFDPEQLVALAAILGLVGGCYEPRQEMSSGTSLGRNGGTNAGSGVGSGGQGSGTGGNSGRADAPVEDLAAPGSDAVAPPMGACETGRRRCGTEQTPEVCVEGVQWAREGQACPNVCTGEGMCTGDCKPGAKRCGGTNMLIPETCDEAGKWVAGTACANLCSSGSCGGSCRPGDMQCGANQTPETCSPMGTWEPGNACQFVCTGAGVCGGLCRPGAVQCAGNQVQTCTAAGDWKDSQTCPFVCTAGACTGNCVPTDRQCNGNTPQTCVAGKWVDGDACPKVGDKPGQCTGKGMCGAGACPPATNDCGGNQCRACCSQCCSNSMCPRVGDKPGVCNNGTCGAGSCPQGTSDCGGNQCRACCSECCNDSMCGNNESCRNGRCATNCTVGPCGTNNACTSGTRQCPSGNCVQTPRNQCGQQGDKTGTCSNNSCQYRCPSGTIELPGNKCEVPCQVSTCKGYQCGPNNECRTSCTNNSHCATNFYCVELEGGCQPQGGSGAGCEHDGECRSGRCNLDLMACD